MFEIVHDHAILRMNMLTMDVVLAASCRGAPFIRWLAC